MLVKIVLKWLFQKDFDCYSSKKNILKFRIPTGIIASKF
jgi:hypothetical protein